MKKKRKKAPKRGKVVTLEISSWVGTAAIGAQHYYGKLYYHDEAEEYGSGRHELEHTLNAKEAKEMTYLDNRAGHTDIFKWRKGSTTSRMASEEMVRAEARRQWKEVCPGAEVLLEGGFAVCGPQECMEGPAWFKAEADRLWAEWPGYDVGKDEKCEALTLEWDALMERFENSSEEV